MENKIDFQLKINKIREMKHPTILMNSSDFDIFKNKVESKIQNFKVGEYPTYQNIPIKSRDFVKKGNIIVYDDILNVELLNGIKSCNLNNEVPD
jgi:hypothetical protein